MITAAQMRAGGEGGRIVATSSVHAQMPFAQMSVYGGTKQAVGHLVGVMAREWARDGITVNHIGPGWVASAINDTSPDFSTEEARLGVQRIIPVGHRAGEPEEMGEAVAYLAGDEARYTTGAYIRVDGGLVLRGPLGEPHRGVEVVLRLGGRAALADGAHRDRQPRLGEPRVDLGERRRERESGLEARARADVVLLRARHPVQPHRQLTGHRHLGHAVVLLGLQSGIHPGQVLISSCCAGRALHQEKS